MRTSTASPRWTAGLGGYPPAALRAIFADYAEVELRRMHEQSDDVSSVGVPFLWTALFAKRRP